LDIVDGTSRGREPSLSLFPQRLRGLPGGTVDVIIGRLGGQCEKTGSSKSMVLFFVSSVSLAAAPPPSDRITSFVILVTRISLF